MLTEVVVVPSVKPIDTPRWATYPVVADVLVVTITIAAVGTESGYIPKYGDVKSTFPEEVGVLLFIIASCILRYYP